MKNWQNNRIIAFGDSYTYGHGLRDCYTPPKDGKASQAGKHPSEYVYSSLLAKDLGTKSYINKSIPGCSNRYMLSRIYSTDYMDGDIVVVGWSYMSRDFIWIEKQPHWIFQNFGPWVYGDEKNFPILYGWLERDMLDNYIRSMETIIAGYTYLAHQGVRTFMFNVDGHFTRYINDLAKIDNSAGLGYAKKLLQKCEEILNLQMPWLKAYKVSLDNDDWALDKDDPLVKTPHAGHLTQRAFADEIRNLLDKNQGHPNIRVPSQFI